MKPFVVKLLFRLRHGLLLQLSIELAAFLNVGRLRMQQVNEICEKKQGGKCLFLYLIGCGVGCQFEPVVGRETSHVKDMPHLPGIFLFVPIYFFISVILFSTVTSAPARLDSRPVANGYLGRLPTYKTTRPCQDATNG